MIRIEADVYFSRKFINLFKNKENKKRSMNLINEVITEIFDKHGYMNSFVTVAGKSKELKEKMNKNLLPRFKNKLYATSNYIEQIFNNDMSDIITKSNIDMKQDLEQRKNFIAEQKINFVSDFLKKMNNNLEKRHLKPIFSIRDKNIEFKKISSNSSSMINIRRFKTPLNPIINNNIINNNIENENINERYELKNKNEKDEISNKSTETKNTLFPNESKIND
jgi:hypothetical protein